MLGSHEEVPPGVWRIESWQLCSREKSCPQWLARVRATIRLMVRSLVRASEPGEHGNRTIEQLPDGCCTWAPKVQGRGWGRVHGRRVGTGWQENDKCPNVGAWLVADKPVRQREEREDAFRCVVPFGCSARVEPMHRLLAHGSIHYRC